MGLEGVRDSSLPSVRRGKNRLSNMSSTEVVQGKAQKAEGKTPDLVQVGGEGARHCAARLSRKGWEDYRAHPERGKMLRHFLQWESG